MEDENEPRADIPSLSNGERKGITFDSPPLIDNGIDPRISQSLGGVPNYQKIKFDSIIRLLKTNIYNKQTPYNKL